MKLSVEQLRNCADRFLVEPIDACFVILKTPKTDAAAFDAFVRDAIDSSGQGVCRLATDRWLCWLRWSLHYSIRRPAAVLGG